MIISVVNLTNGKLQDHDALKAIRAINRQLEGDFAPYWGFGAQLRLEGPVTRKPGKDKLVEMRGDAVLYLWDQMDEAGADGYHFMNHRGIPYGIVNVALAKKLAEDWSVTFSHETLELLGDPQTNLLAQGPHPDDQGKKKPRLVYHWFEMCDAVQAESYEIDGLAVSNFVLPLYFTVDEQVGGRNDYLGRKSRNGTLRSFGINPGGYVGFFDPDKHDDDTRDADVAGKRRRKLKKAFGIGRGMWRRRRRAGVLVADAGLKRAGAGSKAA